MHPASKYAGVYNSGFLRKDKEWIDYGKTYSKGDIVGCGIDWENSQFFFTLNGKQLSESLCFSCTATGLPCTKQRLETMDHALKQRIYPVMGFRGRNAIGISARFAGPFKYNTE